MLAVAMVLAPRRGDCSLLAVQWALGHGPAHRAPLRTDAARSCGDNALADALPLLETIAIGHPARLDMPVSATLSLQLEIGPP
jgi:hypothetical protein